MSEGEHIPETQPKSPTEKSKEFIKDSYFRLKLMGLNAASSGVFGAMAVENFAQGNTRLAVLQGIGAALSAICTANEGFRLGNRIKNLSEENAKLQEINR